MPLQEGIYEQLITKIVSSKLQELQQDTFYVSIVALDKAEASRYLSHYLSETINFALNSIKGEGDILKKIEISNKFYWN